MLCCLVKIKSLDSFKIIKDLIINPFCIVGGDQAKENTDIVVIINNLFHM